MERILNGSFMTRPLWPSSARAGPVPRAADRASSQLPVTIIPFRPWLPAPDQAQAVVSPPFDVPTRVEAAAMAQGDRRNFLHVVRADVDLPNDLPAHLLRAELKVTDRALAAAGVEEMLKRHRGIAGASLRAATRRSARFGHGEPGRRSLGGVGMFAAPSFAFEGRAVDAGP